MAYLQFLKCHTSLAGGDNSPTLLNSIFRLRELLLQVQSDPDIPQRLGYQCPHVLIEGSHHLRRPADQGNLQAMPHQCFRHLQADVAAADDNPPFHSPLVETPANLQAAFEGVYSADVDGIGAGEVRAERDRPGGDQELVIGLPLRFAAFQVADTHRSPRRIDLLHLVQNSRVDSIPLPELFRGADNELFFLVDNPADVIGNPSGGKRGMWAPLEDDDPQLGTATPRLGGGAHPRGIAADDDQSLFGHDSCSCMGGRVTTP